MSITPRLTVVPVSDSFAAVWPALAAECGLELSAAGESPAGEARPGVTAVNAAGAEETLGSILAGLREQGDTIAAVGALPDHRIALAAIRAGAAEYFALPQDYELLRRWLLERAQALRVELEGASFARREATKYEFAGILGDSTALRETLARAARIIPHAGVTVLITGETGTGKELLARAIHYHGPRREAPFIEVNCAAIPEHLLESELFGYEKGAFTGAAAAKPGLFEVADGGTVFLDEIGHLSLPLQGKLLRVLEQRTFRRVGGTAPRSADVRIVAATHVDLAAAVRRGEFREDLYYRLNVVELRLPPLRERGDDVVLLARAFLRRFALEYGLPEPALTPAAERRLLAHPWTGNVRELRNVLERAILLLRGPVLDAPDLQLDPPGTVPGDGAVPFPATMAEITRAAARAMLRLCEGNKSEAARRLRISRTRLLRLLGASRRSPRPEAHHDA
ncbi:MAG TPA: sigma-54 dependent transcriptional regulator [Gemmatimonadales bacterium]|nr:sigma-54 dependent transcriptional regulator [Gemmatimonadales bacterium]